LKQPEAIQLSEKEFAPIVPTLQALREQIERTQEINDRDKFEFSR